jgi:hypothetical protein
MGMGIEELHRRGDTAWRFELRYPVAAQLQGHWHEMNV